MERGYVFSVCVESFSSVVFVKEVNGSDISGDVCWNDVAKIQNICFKSCMEKWVDCVC